MPVKSCHARNTQRWCQLSHSEQGRKWNPPEKQIWSKMDSAVCKEIDYLCTYCWVRGVFQILGKRLKAWVWVSLGFGESLRLDGIHTFVTEGRSWCQLPNCGFHPGWVMRTFTVQGPQALICYFPSSHMLLPAQLVWLTILFGVCNTDACSVL